SFEGRAEEAIAFYVATLGAEVDMMLRFRDAPPPDAGGCQPPEGTPLPPPEKIMHARLTFGTAGVMVSDGMCMGDSKAVFTGFA
ncbi:VOC family protein, partial [Klebsiella pneumoniae]|nr:VOC family protein [Klebsiella pneumoniae]